MTYQPCTTEETRCPAWRQVDATYPRIGKRAFDLVAGPVLLVLAAPILAFLMLALSLEGANPIFKQLRLGKDGRPYRMWKLRTMIPDAEAELAYLLRKYPALRAEWDATQKLKHDPRVTPLGQLLRRTSVDELPQLFNVIMGDMSLVGPRPILPEQLPIYANPDVYLSLRPGITGLWQVTARNEQAFEMRALLDREYHEGLSFRSDLSILKATFGAVVRATGC